MEETKTQDYSNIEIEDLLTMLGGEEYYSMDQICYVYHKLHKEDEEADYYFNEIQRKNKSIQKKLNKLKPQFELIPSNNKIDDIDLKNDIEI